MKKSDVLISTLVLSVYQILCCMVIYFATWMAQLILEKIVLFDYFSASVVQAVLLFVGVGALILVYAYHTAYRTASFDLGAWGLSALLATLIHTAIGAVFSFLPLLCGAASPLSGVIAFGGGYVSPEIHAQIPAFLPTLVFFLVMIFYHAVSLPVGYFAYKRRLKDRRELTGQTE